MTVDIRSMSYEELATFIHESDEATLNANSYAITDRLASFAWGIGELWDKVDGTDPRKGKRVQYGTPNRSSKTYKLRKAAGFSYP